MDTNGLLDTMAYVFGVVVAAAGGLGSVVATAAVLRRWWEKSVGRRQRGYRRLARLAANVQVDFFTAVLGPPAMKRRLESGRREFVYVDPDFFIQAIADEEDTVVIYSITLRTERFRPRVPWYVGRDPRNEGYAPLHLGKDSFAQAARDQNPLAVRGFLGARRFGYAEVHYFGNPGNYQTFALSYNDAGWGGELAELPGIFDANSPDNGTWITEVEMVLTEARMRQFRDVTAPNTYTVSAPHVSDLVGHDEVLGCDWDQVRVFVS